MYAAAHNNSPPVVHNVQHYYDSQGFRLEKDAARRRNVYIESFGQKINACHLININRKSMRPCRFYSDRPSSAARACLHCCGLKLLIAAPVSWAAAPSLGDHLDPLCCSFAHCKKAVVLVARSGSYRLRVQVRGG